MAKNDKAAAPETAVTAPADTAAAVAPAAAVDAPVVAPDAPEAPVIPPAHDEVAGAEALEALGPVGALTALAAAEAAPAHALEHAAAVNLRQKLGELKRAIEGEAHHLGDDARAAVAALHALL